MDGKIADRLSKLLRLAEGSNSEAEAMEALRMARELARREGITIEDFDMDGDAVSATPVVEVGDALVDFLAVASHGTWCGPLANACAIIAGAKVAYWSPDRSAFCIAGTAPALAMTVGLWHALVRFMEAEAARSFPGYGSRRSFNASFRAGFSLRVRKRAEEMRASEVADAKAIADASNGATTALAIVCEHAIQLREKATSIAIQGHLNEKGIKLHTKTTRFSGRSEAGWSAGKAAGDRASLAAPKMIGG